MLENQVALVTGASRGIGNAIALALGGAGARIIGTSTSAEGASRIGELLASHGYNGRGAVLDASDPASIDALLAQLEEASELPTLLINNAAITRDTLLLRMKPEDWDAVITTNLTSVYRLCRACVRHMMKERRGRIVNLTSVVGLTGNPGQANYAAAKAGLLGFTKSLARELARYEINVNCVCPGPTDTPLFQRQPERMKEALTRAIPFRRIAQPIEIANAVLFFLSRRSDYITGQVLSVSGGLTMVG